jgi:WD40 repeat protein
VIWRIDGTRSGLLHGDQHLARAQLSPDGRRIVSVSNAGGVQMWSIDGREFAPFMDYPDRTQSAAFSPDGELIVTASWDSTARVWHADGTPLEH